MTIIKKLFPFVYIIFLIAAFFYVRGVLSTEELEVDTKESQKEVEEVKPVDIRLLVVGSKDTIVFSKRMKNTNTFDDLLESLVEERGLTYEKTEYVYGTEYGPVNGESAPQGFLWRVFADDDEVTFKTKGLRLRDNVTYKLELDERDENE